MIKVTLSFLSLVAAVILGFVACGIWDHLNPGYIDRTEAIAQANEIAQDDCLHYARGKIRSCGSVAIAQIDEKKDGWYINFRSSEIAGRNYMFVGRRGEYDSMGDDWF